MYSDAQINDSMIKMMRAFDVPTVPLQAIAQRIAQPQVEERRPMRASRFALSTAAAAAIAAVALATASPAFVQALEDRYSAALRALGITPPPPAPKRLVSSLTSQRVTLAAAQSQVPFTIVAPEGLPRDAGTATITTSKTGVYSNVSHTWHTGTAAVTFTYHREDGRSFSLLADHFDATAEPPAKYIYEAKDGPNNQVTLVKHEHFAWRNGEQIMTAIAGEGISSSEILAIQRAMRGVALTLRDTGTPQTGSSIKLYRAPKP